MKQKINKIFLIFSISSTIILLIIVSCMVIQLVIWKSTNFRVDINFPFSLTNSYLFSVVGWILSIFMYGITQSNDDKITKSDNHDLIEFDKENQLVYREIKAKHYHIKKTSENKNINRKGRWNETKM